MSPDPPARHRWGTLAVLCVTLLLISMDSTVLNVALPTIVRTLDASSSQLQWVVDAYAVVFAGLLLSMGALGDRLGRKWVFLGGLLVFGGGSAAAALSGSPDRLTLARAVMGVGAAALMPSTLSILTNVFTGEADRAKAIGIWSGSTGIGVAIGPILGGFLLAHFWWGSVFLVNVPIVVVGVAAAIWLVPNSRNPSASRPDPIGSGLSIIGLGLLLWGIIEAPSRGWSSPEIIGALVGAGGIIIAFVLWEHRSDHPMLPVRFFADRRYSAAIGALALVLFALMGMFFLMTQYLQFVLGFSALQAGVRIAPVALALLVLAPTSVVAARRVGTKAVVVPGMLLIALGLGILSRTAVGDSYGRCILPLLLVGVGVALSLAPCTEAVMGSLPRSEAGVGSATNDTAMQIGAALGVGVLGTALDLRYQHLLTPVISRAAIPQEVQRLIQSSIGGALAVAQRAPAGEGAALALVARRSFVSGMDLALVIATVVVALAAGVVAGFLPNRGKGATVAPVTREAPGGPDRRDGTRDPSDRSTARSTAGATEPLGPP